MGWGHCSELEKKVGEVSFEAVRAEAEFLAFGGVIVVVGGFLSPHTMGNLSQSGRMGSWLCAEDLEYWLV